MARVTSPCLQNVQWLGNINDASWGHRWSFWTHRPAAEIPEHQLLLFCLYKALWSWVFPLPQRDRYPELIVLTGRKKQFKKKNTFKNLSVLFLARRQADLASNRCHYLLPKEYAVCSFGSIWRIRWPHLKSSRNRKDRLKKVFGKSMYKTGLKVLTA